MELLKYRLQALNTLKKADDNTLNTCFDGIVAALFDDRRSLIKYLLASHHKLEKGQMIQIKDILNAELKRLIDVQTEESDDADIDIEKEVEEQIIPTLRNISEHVQVHITSFLDFPSIKNLSAVCMSIAPIALDQFSKIDIKICNIHQLNNEDQHIRKYDIIRANTKKFRVRRSDNPTMFIQNKFGIESENVVVFDTYALTEYELPTIFQDNRSYRNVMVVGDKTKLNIIEHDRNPTECHYRLLFVQQFDFKRQRLSIQKIATTNRRISVAEIKKVIGKDDVTLFRVSKASRTPMTPESDDDNDIFLNETSNVFDQLSEDYMISLRELSRSDFIYQDILSDTEHKKIENEFHQNLEPFYSSLSEFYRVQEAERMRPGSKYIAFGKDLKRKGFDAKERAKYFKKAYDINPNDPVVSNIYIDALTEPGVDDDDWYCEIFEMFMELKRYKEAERIALKLIEITKDKDDELYKKSLERIINLYKNYLHSDEAAEEYQTLMIFCNYNSS